MTDHPVGRRLRTHIESDGEREGRVAMMRVGKRQGALRRTTSVLALAGVVVLAGLPAFGSATRGETLAPGESLTIEQSVDIPFIPPKPDIVLVIDRTGSMGPAITDVKSKIADLVATIQTTEPDARFAAVAYCDTGEATPAVSTLSGLSGNASAVIDAVIAMPLCYGGDLPESQLDALSQIGNGSAVDFRPDSNRIIAWFGDAPGHLRGASLDGTLSSLKKSNTRVVAVSVGKNQLNSSGQAARITQATGGTLLSNVATNNVAASLLQGLTSLPVEITAKAECDLGLNVEFDRPTLTVPSGETTTFAQTLTVSSDAQPGTELACEVRFWIDGKKMGSDWVQEINVTVASGPTTAPTDEADDPAVTDSPSAEPSEAPEPSAESTPSETPDVSASAEPTQEPTEQVVPQEQVQPTEEPAP